MTKEPKPEIEKLYCYVCLTTTDFEVARGSAHVEARDSAHVVAWDSAHVEAWGSAHVEARDSAHVEAWGSAHVEARGSAHVVARGSAHVVARDSAHVVARGSAHVEAKGPLAVAIRRSPNAKVSGLLVVQAFEQSTEPMDWLKSVGAKVSRGKAILYKRTGPEFETQYGIRYVPGTGVEAPDWDGGNHECGGGLHFCGDPAACDLFRDKEGDRYVACEVVVADIVVHARPDYPDKIKARRCKVLYEVDREGNRIEEAPASETA